MSQENILNKNEDEEKLRFNTLNILRNCILNSFRDEKITYLFFPYTFNYF